MHAKYGEFSVIVVASFLKWEIIIIKGQSNSKHKSQAGCAASEMEKPSKLRAKTRAVFMCSWLFQFQMLFASINDHISMGSNGSQLTERHRAKLFWEDGETLRDSEVTEEDEGGGMMS